MSGSRLGRGRGGRLVLYGGVLIIIVIFVWLYRTCSIEMARLQELHVQCSHQQEALAAQLQVIYEYKVRLEKSLQEEKNTNQALKQELQHQQRVSREKSLRDKDKDTVEIVQRYNAMQQKYNILQSENKDIQEECTKRQKQALEESNRLESTLRDLRGEISRAQEDKKKSLENLKTKYLTIQKDYAKMETEYNNLVKNSVSSNSSVLHLEKQVFQLKRELEQAKKSISPSDYAINRAASQQLEPETNQDKSRAHSANEQVARPSQQQQQQNTSTHLVKSVPSSNLESTTKAYVASVSPEKSSPTGGKTKGKLPIGVVPIPVLRNPKLENEDPKRYEKKRHPEAGRNSLVKNFVVENGNKEKAKELVIGNLDLLPHQPAGKVDDRQGNGGWLRVQPGVQEIGDEPNHLGRMAGLEDGAQQGPDIGEDPYENDEFYREPQPKNNDLRIDEGEDEGEDEDDQLDYPNNNLKHEKHE